MPSRFLAESQTVWSTQVTGSGGDATPALFQGRLFYASNVGGHGALHAVDIQSAAVPWSWQDTTASAAMTYRPTVANGLVLAGTSGGLRAHDAQTGKTAWTYTGKGAKKTAVVCAPASDGTQVVFAQEDGYYRALTLEGSLAWEVQVLGTQFSTAAFAGSTVLFAINNASPQINMLYAVDATSGQQLWTYSAASPIFTDPAVGVLPGNGQGLVFIGCEDGTVRAVNLAGGTEAWRFTTQGSVSSTPCFFNGAVYFGSDDANFYAVDAATGTLLWKLPASSSIVTGIFISDGVAYFGTLNTGANQPALIAVDLQSQGTDVVQFAVQNAVAFAATMQNGVVYFFDGVPATGGSIVAVNLEDVVHEFFAESVLMVSTYDTSGAAPAPQTPAYRTALKLFDDQKNARPAQAVKVWASGPVSITVAGTPYAIDSATPAWVQTDAAGELVIEASSPQLPMPSLSLWASFMAPEETVVVYSDHQTVQTLSAVQGDDLDPANATKPAVGYDGQPILQSQYAGDPASRNAIASAIQNALGTPATAQALFRGVAADAPTNYLAFPQSMPNSVYVPSGGAQTRPLVLGQQQPAWTLDFSSGSASFSPTASSLAHPRRAVPLSIFSKIADFIENVVHGVDQVLTTVWQWVENAVQIVIHTLKNTYNLVIQTLEDALNVVVGFLKSVVDDIDKAFEWLSWVFDFKDMATNAGLISSQVLSSLTNLQGWLTGVASADIATFFGNLESAAQRAFQTMSDKVGSGSFQDTQQNQTDPQTTYNQGGAQSYSQSRWMLEKVQANAGSLSAASMLATLPLDDSGTTLSDAVNGFITSVQQTVASDTRFTELWPQVQGGFNAMIQLATSGGQASQASLQQLLGGLEAIVELLIELGEVVAEALVTLLADLIGGIQALLTSPLPMPFINDIYKLITGNDLRVVDLAAFVVSVPATIVSKIVSGQSQGTSRALATQSISTLFFYGALFSGLSYAIFDAGSDLSDMGAGWDTTGVAFSLIFWALNYPEGEPETQDWLYWSLGLVPIAISAAAIKYSEGFFGETLVPWLLSASGVGLAVTAAVFAAEWDSFLGEDGLVLVQNLVSCIPLILKPAKLAGPESRPILAVVDVIGDGATAILDLVNFEASQNSSLAVGKLVSA